MHELEEMDEHLRKDTRLGTGFIHLGTGFIQTLVRALGSIGRAKAAEHTYNRLTNMSDAGLASRGVQREDIRQIVIQQLLTLRQILRRENLCL